MDEFSKQKAVTSAQCKFWEEYLRITGFIKDLIKADRDGNFLLHIQTMISLCPVFGGCRAINYYRHGSFYVKTLKQMKTNQHEVYLEFLNGGFVVKRNKGKFNSVAPDMALEQTIQRSAKSTRGIIGETKSKSYCAEWSLIYHDVLSIVNDYRTVTNSQKRGNNETLLHNHLTDSKILEYNSCLDSIVAFMKTHGNPYSDSSDGKLKIFATQAHAADEVAKTRLDFESTSTANFKGFHDRVFVQKSSSLFDKIPRSYLPSINQSILKANEADKSSKSSLKSSQVAFKTLLIAKDKTGARKLELQHDITTYNYLFDGEFMSKPNKYELVHELKNLHFKNETDWSLRPKLSSNSVVIIDFMAYVRSLGAANSTENVRQITFGSFADGIFRKIITTNSPCKTFHLIFDSYIDESVKGSERERHCSGGYITLANIKEQTPLPQQMDKFWSSTHNKVLLQRFIQDHFTSLTYKSGVRMFFSGIVDGKHATDCMDNNGVNSSVKVVPELKLNIEEADARIIPHIAWHLKQFGDCDAVLVESNDSDVVVYLLYYMHYLSRNETVQVWTAFGKGSNASFLPIHFMYKKLGHNFCKCFLKVHIGTGSDYISKVGTKKSALKANPVANLNSFGETPFLDDSQVKEAERYLVLTFSNPNAPEKTFDKLRCKVYKRKADVLSLPPTSNSIVNGHIRRWWYIYKKMANLFSAEFDDLSPEDYGWSVEDGILLPEKSLKLLPDEYCTICSCKAGCKNKRCSCFKDGMVCSEFCKCSSCQNSARS